MRVKLKELLPFSLRDFTVDPLDKERVKALKDSIKDKGFWSGIVCRKTKVGIELIAGAHRVEAAIKAGIEEADVFVGTFDDDAALDVYFKENALQRNNAGTALMGAITAAVKLEVVRALTCSGQLAGAELTATEAVRGHLCGKNGIGRDVLEKRFPDLGEKIIRQQLANLKSSEHYARIIMEVYDEMKRAKTYDRETLDLAAKAAAAAGNAIPTFDYVGVAEHLKVPSHVDAFRKMATCDEVVAYEGHPGYLKMDGQASVAEKLVKMAEKQDVAISAPFIRDNFMDQLRQAKGAEKKLNKKENEALKRKDWTHKTREHQSDASKKASGFLTACMDVADDARHRPDGVTLHITTEFRQALEKVKRAIALIDKALGDDLNTKEGSKAGLKLISSK